MVKFAPGGKEAGRRRSVWLEEAVSGRAGLGGNTWTCPSSRFYWLTGSSHKPDSMQGRGQRRRFLYTALFWCWVFRGLVPGQCSLRGGPAFFLRASWLWCFKSDWHCSLL